MASDGSITFSTKLDNSDLEKQLEAARKSVERLKGELEGKEAARDAISAQLDQANESIGRTKERIAELKARWEELCARGDAGGAMAVSEELQKQRESLGRQLDAVSALYDRWSEADAAVDGLAEGLRRAEAEQARLQGEFGRLYRARDGQLYASRMQAAMARVSAAGARAAAAVRSAHARAAAAMQAAYARAARALSGMFARMLPFMTLTGGLYAITSQVKELLAQTEGVNRSASALKAVCSGIAAEVARVVAPVVLGFMRAAMAMLMALARLVDSVFKTNFVGAVNGQAASANAAAKAQDGQAKATKRLAKATKEASRQLMAFDELNVLNAEQSDDDASGLDGIADDLQGGAGAGAQFDPSLITKGVDAALAQIMLLAGAALLAVGLILALSGINVPLGLTLAAMGALMLYTAYSEDWGGMPEDVRSQLEAVVAIAAGALIAVGLVLCAAGNLPLGIGFIVAGAALFAAEYAMDPAFMESLVAKAFDHILALVAGALVVVGVMLCVAGHPVAGIAFVIAGMALLVGEAVLDWNLMPESVRSFLDGMVAAIGGALVVVGLLLCVTGHPVLGIAAILAGVTAFVIAAVIDDEDAPNRIRLFLSRMVPVIGKALIVVGVLLCVVGNLPLGIAAIVLGIGIWVLGGAVLDESLAKDKITGFIEKMLPAIGRALVVVGVILCVFGSLPVGIAAMALGALIWVTGATLNGKLTAGKIEAFISDVLPTIAGAMVVLGVILCATGVAVGVGVSLIVAGIGALGFSMLSIDWGFILNCIKAVWADIGRWFDNNVAPVFTWQWWEDKFKCIANGLISALNGALGGAASFAGNLLGGFLNIANSLGFPFSYSFSFPKIPYLASGAVIPPNREFLAVLGDQRRGVNIETPEALMRQVVREEAGGADAADMQRAFAAALMQVLPLFASRGGEAGDLVIELDGDVIARKVAAANAAMSRRNILAR